MMKRPLACKQLKGWYAYQLTYMVMFIVGITTLFDKWGNFWISMMMVSFSLIILLATIIVPMVRVVEKRVEIYDGPSFKPLYIFLIKDIRNVELLNGYIEIRLQSGKSVTYRPSPLEIELIRVVTFINEIKE